MPSHMLWKVRERKFMDMDASFDVGHLVAESHTVSKNNSTVCGAF